MIYKQQQLVKLFLRLLKAEESLSAAQEEIRNALAYSNNKDI